MELNRSQYKTLAQAVSSTAPTIVYMPSLTSGLVWYLKKINLCNTWADTTVNLGVVRNGDTIAQTKQYIEFWLPIKANESYTLALDIGLLSGDGFFVTAGTTGVAINIYGEEYRN